MIPSVWRYLTIHGDNAQYSFINVGGGTSFGSDSPDSVLNVLTVLTVEVTGKADVTHFIDAV